ncbi:MAG: hypothetical protein QNJ31_03495 [Candidatus Caenarcaniphilales bacterium]|nr:hypothetical protein [Candidatus Caenarcaniphilales bacterium]
MRISSLPSRFRGSTSSPQIFKIKKIDPGERAKVQDWMKNFVSSVKTNQILGKPPEENTVDLWNKLTGDKHPGRSASEN